MPVVTHPGPSAPLAPAVRFEIPDARRPQPSGDAPGIAVRYCTGTSLVVHEVGA